MKNNTVCGVILAAGMSTRMNDFKPLLPLKGKTVIENTIDSMLSGGVLSVVVVVGYQGRKLSDLIGKQYGENVIIAWNNEYESTDMLYSLQTGVKSLPKCDGFFLLPADMPLIQPSTFSKVLETWRSGDYDIVFPTIDNRRKHPPLIDARLIPEILNFHETQFHENSFQENGGVRQLWKQHEDRIGVVAVDDLGVCVDLDTPEDYKRADN
jgi:CTP:molybdopterin cytidylyltransferase MocA